MAFKNLLSCLTLIGAALLPFKAMADGFVCTSVDQDTRFAIYYDSATLGGRQGPRATKMIVVDPTVSAKHQLIAQFSAKDGLLNNSGSVVVAYVDLTHPDSSRRGERIGGTVLGALHSIVFEIDFSYEEPANQGSQLAAQAVFTKKNGRILVQDYDCVRYSNADQMASALWFND